ncbi:MAG: hypothetical protein OEM41_09650 [Ignavibacteria bacterium]|nr:hypothetical protein [Ignavibacteria bacterium]
MRRLLCCLAIVACVSPARAVEGSSSYSILGIGDIRFASGVRSAGMGYTGTALPGANYINLLSPGTWSRINRTRLEAGFLMEGFNSSDANSSRYLANGSFGGASLAIPISPSHGFVFTGGFTPFSNTSYDIFTSATEGGIGFSVHNVGTGGFSRGRAGFSYAPGPDLALGAAVEYTFGNLTRTTTLTPIGGSLAGGTTKEKTSARGTGALVGAVYSGFGGLAESLKPLVIGFSFSSRATLRGTTLRNSETQNETDSTSEVITGLAIPYQLSIGAAYQLGERYLFTADYSRQPWSTADLGAARNSEIRDSYRFGFGVERFGSREQFAGWIKRLVLRLGFYYEETYYIANGTGINAWGVTGGMAIPLSGETRLNIALEYGGRGTARNNLIKDNIFRLSLSLNLSEEWFVQYNPEE